MTRWLRCLALVSFLLVPLTAQAASLEEAERLYADAQKLTDAGQHEQALNLYIQAYSTYPQAKYVFSIASSYVQLGNLPRALDAYEQFNQYDPTPEVLQRVQAEVKKIKELLSKDYGEIFVFSSPSGVQIIVGEISKQNIYATPARRWVKAGQHTVLFKKEGFFPRELKITVEEGEHLFIYAGLKPEKK